VASPVSCLGLTKSFGSTLALDGLDLEVTAGEIHGFLGPNGAGKTVTMRILLGLLRAGGGRVAVFGADPWADAVSVHRRLAYVPGDTNLWPNLTGGEILDLLGSLRGGLDPTRRAELVDRFDLDPTRKARAYSKGNRQKVALVAALASDAELLVLDEPTTGLDPLMEAVFQDVLLDARAAGRTVLLSSHVLAEVEKVCDRVTIIRRGRTVETGSLAQLRALTRTTVVAEVRADPGGLAALAGVHALRRQGRDGRQVTFEVDRADLDTVIAALAALGIESLASRPPTLEDLFLRHYGEELVEAGVHEAGGAA
jgi:ABC-2 type transport system ATP-binding protein